MSTQIKQAIYHATTPYWISQLLTYQRELDAGQQYLASRDYTDHSIQSQMIVRGLVATRELVDMMALIVQHDGVLLFAWQGTKALINWEGGAA